MGERIELEDLQLAYEDRGPASPGGSTVVFVHGLGGSAYSWWGQLAACEERGHRAVAYDQRGAGRSSKPPGPYSIELWARDLERLLDGLEVERAMLVGHSVGCMIAEHAAVRLGERVRGLALIGGALRWRPEAGPVFEERVRLARAGRMDEIARAVAETGLSERCRRREPCAARPLLRADRLKRPAGLRRVVGGDGRRRDGRARAGRLPHARPLRRARPGDAAGLLRGHRRRDSERPRRRGRGRGALVPARGRRAAVSALLLEFLDEIAT